MADFDLAINFVLKNEGGYVNNPQDLGGPTNMGVTMDLFAKFKNRPVSIPEMMILKEEDAKEVYRIFFWVPLKIATLDQAIATAILDTAINEGQYSAIRLAQLAVGSAMPDGQIGPQTLNELSVADPRSFIKAFVKETQGRYVTIATTVPGQLRFLKGWLNRSLRLLEFL